MSRARQLSLFKDPRKNTKLWWIRKQNVYGGSLRYRKVARPFDSKKLSHTVLKTQLGPELRFTKFSKMVRETVAESASRYGLKVKDVAIHHDHIHLLTYTKSREAQTLFLRFVSAELGRQYAQLRKKFRIKRAPLWVDRPFTRLVSWGKRSVQNVKKYFVRNRGEALGFLEYRPRNHALATFMAKWGQQDGLSSG